MAKNKFVDAPTGRYWEIYNILKELFMTSFSWKGLPPSVNQRFMELSLFDFGKVVFFKDEVMQKHLALKAIVAGNLDVYYEPTTITAYGGNGYNKNYKNNKDCIIIYNNFVRDTPHIRVLDYAKRIHQIEKTIDINVHAQKTPILIKTSQKHLLTLKNFYKQYDEFEPVIIVDSDLDELSKIGVVETNAEFIARDLMDLKKQIWNEALSYIGIENNSAEKNERLTANEVMVSNGLAIASRNAKLQARQTAVDQINLMFGLSIEVDVNNLSIMEVEGGIMENE
jgi:hypothetical protein